VVDLLTSGESKELNDAMFSAGLTEDTDLHHHEGAIGVLTGGRINRKDNTKLGVLMALLQLDHGELYTI